MKVEISFHITFRAPPKFTFAKHVISSDDKWKSIERDWTSISAIFGFTSSCSRYTFTGATFLQKDSNMVTNSGLVQTPNFSCAEPNVNNLSSFALGSAHEMFDV